MSVTDHIPFIDLHAQRRRLGTKIDEALQDVLTHGQFIMGPEVSELEHRLEQFCSVGHALTCANGTDALTIAMMALGVGPNSAVLMPSFTFAATAEAAALLGATPVFCDVLEETFNIDVKSIEAGAEVARRHGLSLDAIISVDLFGQPADYARILPMADKLGATVIGDAAQSLGASYHGKPVGSLCPITTTSFFPAKPLGCYGDGGALFTNDADLARKIDSIRMHGRGQHKYDNVRIGMNSRLDTLQASILLRKLDIFPEELKVRQTIASRYDAGLVDFFAPPKIIAGAVSSWAQYTVRTAQGDRGRLSAALKQRGIPTAVYYRCPLHLQPAYQGFLRASETLPVSEDLAQRVLSLPMHPYLDEAPQNRIIDACGAESRC